MHGAEVLLLAALMLNKQRAHMPSIHSFIHSETVRELVKKDLLIHRNWFPKRFMKRQALHTAMQSLSEPPASPFCGTQHLKTPTADNLGSEAQRAGP